MPTSSISSAARARASSFEIFRCAFIMSTNWSPTRISGLSEFIALWKTIETFCQRNCRTFSLLSFVRSSPRNRISPLVTCAGARSSCMIAFAIVLLPQPDSPASPTISPSPMLRLTWSTARTRRPPRT